MRLEGEEEEATPWVIDEVVKLEMEFEAALDVVTRERDLALFAWEAAGMTGRTAQSAMLELARRLDEARAEVERLKTFAAQTFSQMIRQEAEQMRVYGLSYEGVRAVLREHDNGEISFGKLMDLIRAATRAMAEADKRAASNLLAIIHGDGGHYENAHGTVKACKDAEGVVSDLRVKLDAATYARQTGCQCQWEAGDSPCKVHGDDDK